MDQIIEEEDKAGYGAWMTTNRNHCRQMSRPTVTESNPSPRVGGNGYSRSANKMAKNQQTPPAVPTSGSWFHVLTDPISEEVNVGQQAAEVAQQMPSPSAGRTAEMQNPKVVHQKAKGKEIAKEYSAMASKESLLDDLQPLRSDPIPQTTSTHAKMGIPHNGPSQILKDVTTLPAHQNSMKFNSTVMDNSNGPNVQAHSDTGYQSIKANKLGGSTAVVWYPTQLDLQINNPSH